MGRHRKPTKSGRRIATVGSAIALGTLGPVALASEALAAQPSSAWDVIIRCESGNRNINNSQYPKSTASGYFQITNRTWASAGGLKYAPRAIGATKAQQQEIAQRIAERRGNLDDWAASKGCWDDEISNAVPAARTLASPGQQSTRQAEPKSTPRHANPKSRTAPVYRVKAGDTLTKIAHAQKIQGGWRALYMANRDVINSPDRIFVGQVLQRP